MGDIPDNIRKHRLSSGLSQAQLAEKVGVTRQTVSSWERGASFPDIKMLEDLSSAFDVEIDELLYPRSREKRKRTAAEPLTFRFFFLSVVIYSVLLIWGGGLIAIPLFKKIVGGGITEDFIIVVYWGLILLVAYLALCMCLISEYISGRRDDDTVDNPEN